MAGRCMRVRELQSVIEIVGIETPERAIGVDEFRVLVRRALVRRFDLELLRAR